uniref:Putative glutaredoxin n=1 Tax=viral metagenome TaxID=1070528 RepID=A0A6M3J8R8_9ZZZZ
MEHIKVYTSPRCGACLKVKALLNKYSIPFEELSVLDEKNRSEFLKYGQLTTPITTKGKKVVFGYSLNQLKDLIRKTAPFEAI